MEGGEARGGQEADRDVEGDRGEGAEDEEEHILHDNWLLGEAAEVRGFRRSRCGRGLFDARPGKIDVEEKEEDAKAYYRALERVRYGFAAKERG